MAVAWIGNRETTLALAVEQAALLLDASKSPVIILDTDIHGSRAAIALAERIGAAYDVADTASAVEASLIMDRGAMTIAPGEARRRADMLVFVGPIPKAHAPLVNDFARSTPDLSGGQSRKLFALGAAAKRDLPDGTMNVGSARSGLAATLAAIRATLAGREITGKHANLDVFAAALMAAIFPVFIYSGKAGLLRLEMLQGLVADLNKTRRASTLHLPASEYGWGTVLASGWMTGFAPRTSFARGFPEFDPWRFDVRRMIVADEVDFILSVGDVGPLDTPTPNPSPQGEGGLGGNVSESPSPLWGGVRGGGSSVQVVTHIALQHTSKPLPHAAVTIATGTPGIDHDTVRYSARLGTIAASTATHLSDLPPSATILRMLHERLRGKAAA